MWRPEKDELSYSTRVLYRQKIKDAKDEIKKIEKELKKCAKAKEKAQEVVDANYGFLDDAGVQINNTKSHIGNLSFEERNYAEVIFGKIEDEIGEYEAIIEYFSNVKANMNDFITNLENKESTYQSNIRTQQTTQADYERLLYKW